MDVWSDSWAFLVHLPTAERGFSVEALAFSARHLKDAVYEVNMGTEEVLDWVWSHISLAVCPRVDDPPSWA